MTRSRPSSSILIEPVISSASSASSRDFAAKRIRFAPLPEPGHEDYGITTHNHPTEQSYLDTPPEDLTASSSSSSSSNSTTLIIDNDKSSPGSSGASSPIILSPSSSILDNHIPSSEKSNPLFRPFKRFTTSSSSSSSNTLTPSSKEEISSSGVNLFKTTSRESTHSTSSRWSGLGRINIPLTRTPSNQSHKSTSSPRFPLFPSSPSSPFSFSSDSKPKPKAKPIPLGQQQRNRHKGTIILNGRVYGGSKSANPFANARDEEPEFVEWGYGGMGSVKGAKSAGVSSTWDRLQGGSAMSHDDNIVGVGGVGAGIGATDVELDDGSGMAWLKRRREERERKAREQKEKDAEKESQNDTSIPRSPTMETIVGVGSSPSNSLSVEIATTTPHIPPAIDVSLSPTDPKGGEDTATKYSFPTPTPKEGGETSQLHNSHENERVLQAITVPVRSPRLTHHRSGSKGSRDMSSHLSEGPQVQVVGSPILVSPSGDDDDITDAPAGVLHTSTIAPIGIDKPALKPASFSSSSESEDDGDDDVDEEDDDEEHEEEMQKQNALRSAAGVEKISRHNKE